MFKKGSDFDESSPHLHIIGVTYKDGNKNGMYKQVGKATVFNKESYKNIELSDIIESSNDYIKGIINFIGKMCSEGYIPQEKYEEQGTLFRNDDGKWINGKYYTKEELEKMKKNNGYEL